MWPFNTRASGNAPEQKMPVEAPRSLDLGSLVSWLGWGTSTGKGVTEWSAVDVPAVFSACRAIAEGVSGMPVRILKIEYNAAGRRSKRQDYQHPTYKLLRKPNSFQTGLEFREGMLFNAALGFGSIAIKVMDGKRRIRELLPIPIGSWTVEQLNDYSLRFRVDYADKTHDYFTSDQVFYVRGVSMNGYSALPAVRMAREAIGLSLLLEQQQARLMANGGKPSGVLSFATEITPERREKLSTLWQTKFGPGGEGGIAILDGDANFHSMSISAVDAQYIETRRFQIEEIARAFRIQPIVLMQASSGSAFASVRELFLQHYVSDLGQWVRRFEEAAHRDLLDSSEEYEVDLDETAPLSADPSGQAEYFVKALGSGGQSGWLSVNEIRERIGLNPINEPWADTVSQGQMMQNVPLSPTNGPISEAEDEDIA